MAGCVEEIKETFMEAQTFTTESLDVITDTLVCESQMDDDDANRQRQHQNQPPQTYPPPHRSPLPNTDDGSDDDEDPFEDEGHLSEDDDPVVASRGLGQSNRFIAPISTNGAHPNHGQPPQEAALQEGAPSARDGSWAKSRSFRDANNTGGGRNNMKDRGGINTADTEDDSILQGDDVPNEERFNNNDGNPEGELLVNGDNAQVNNRRSRQQKLQKQQKNPTKSRAPPRLRGPCAWVAAILVISGLVVGIYYYVTRRELPRRKENSSSVDNVAFYEESITLAQLAEHDTPEDCWIALYGTVYDLSEYAKVHPGGGHYITDLAGTDATKSFDDVHPFTYLTDVKGASNSMVGILVEDDEADGGGGGGGEVVNDGTSKPDDPEQDDGMMDDANNTMEYYNGTTATGEIVVSTGDEDDAADVTSANETTHHLDGTLVNDDDQKEVIFISELHYDNVGSDKDQAIEVAATYGMDLTGYVLDFLRDDGSIYQWIALETFHQGVTRSGLTFWTMKLSSMLNGPSNGLALVDGSGNIVDLLSYEGSIVIGEGTHALVTTDIGVSENDVDTPAWSSLQKTGEGCARDDFAWRNSTVRTFGNLNVEMFITCDGPDDSAAPSATPPPPPQLQEKTGGSDDNETATNTSDLDLANQAKVPTIIFISEFHYDNAGDDRNQGIEVMATYGLDVSTYVLDFYSQDGTIYQTIPLGGFEMGSTVGGLTFWNTDLRSMLNSAGFGVALVDDVTDEVIEILSYEGIFTAVEGRAEGMNSTDVGVEENNYATNADTSLQKGGEGCLGSDFVWQESELSTFGKVNVGMNVTCGGIDLA